MFRVLSSPALVAATRAADRYAFFPGALGAVRVSARVFGRVRSARNIPGFFVVIPAALLFAVFLFKNTSSLSFLTALHYAVVLYRAG